MRYGNKTRLPAQVSDWPGNNRFVGWNPRPVSNWTGYANVFSSATAHTKGAWTQIIASTSGVSDCLDISIQSVGASGVDTSALFDIAIGASGSEQAIAENIAIGGAAALLVNADLLFRLRIPVFIPAGSRIAIRTQSTQTVVGGKLIGFAVRLNSGPNPSMTSPKVDVYGTSTVTSTGTQMTTTGWVEITSTSLDSYDSLFVVPSISTATIASGARTLELGIGSSGSEIPLTTFRIYTLNNETIGILDPQLVFGPVVAGTRLATQFSSNGDTGVYCCIIATPRIGI
jgi:hypothetical protein